MTPKPTSPQRGPGGTDIPPALHGNKSANDVEVEQTIERTEAEKIADPTHNVPIEGQHIILQGPPFPG